MVDEPDYESLGDAHPMILNACAGAFAGYFEHVAVYPMDVVKTRMQTIRKGCAPSTSNPLKELINIVKREGYRPLTRGGGAVFIGCGPAHALQFCIFEHTRSVLEEKRIPYLHPISHNIGGAAGAFFHDLWMNPTDVLKQRLQMLNSPYKNQSYVNIVRSIAHNEGIRAFYLSFTTQLFMNVPFAFVHFGLYDVMKTWLNPSNHWDPMSNAVCGAVAGGFAAFLTTPLDVVKTVLNTQEALTTQASCQTCTRDCKVIELHSNNFREAIYRINQSNTSRSLSATYFRGCWARVAAVAPGCALSWIAYEFMKSFLRAETAQKAYKGKSMCDSTSLSIAERTERFKS